MIYSPVEYRYGYIYCIFCGCTLYYPIEQETGVCDECEYEDDDEADDLWDEFGEGGW